MMAARNRLNIAYKKGEGLIMNKHQYKFNNVKSLESAQKILRRRNEKNITLAVWFDGDGKGHKIRIHN